MCCLLDIVFYNCTLKRCKNRRTTSCTNEFANSANSFILKLHHLCIRLVEVDTAIIGSKSYTKTESVIHLAQLNEFQRSHVYSMLLMNTQTEDTCLRTNLCK